MADPLNVLVFSPDFAKIAQGLIALQEIACIELLSSRDDLMEVIGNLSRHIDVLVYDDSTDLTPVEEMRQVRPCTPIICISGNEQDYDLFVRMVGGSNVITRWFGQSSYEQVVARVREIADEANDRVLPYGP